MNNSDKTGSYKLNKNISQVPRLMIAAEKSGCGKTTFTCGLLQLLKNRGKNPVAFKCGPDYIDPMFHEKVLDIPGTNLDPYFSDKEELQLLIKENCSGDSVAVIEGVMGIYDGISIESDRYSSYEVAENTDTPILLLMDARGVGRTLISKIKGILADDRKKLIRGIILNRISEGYYNKIKRAVEDEIRNSGFDVRLAGFLPKLDEIKISSRYLGLNLPSEINEIKEQINLMAEEIEKHCDIPMIMKLMEDGRVEGSENHEMLYLTFHNTRLEDALDSGKTLKLAVARDEAFCFYYKENLKAFERCGVDVVYFSPINDEKIPEGVSGVLFGGGYPENYAKELSENKSMLASVRNAISSGMPCIAECGGFMYMHKSIRTKDGDVFPMTGVIDGSAEYTGHLVRFGYFEIKDCKEQVFKNLAGMKGHEFHYFESTACGEDCQLEKASTKSKYSAMVVDENRVMGFPHLYYNSQPGFIQEFVEVMKKYSKRKRV